MISKTIQNRNPQKTGLTRKLGVPVNINIPTKFLLKISTTPITTSIRNPSGVGRALRLAPVTKKQFKLVPVTKKSFNIINLIIPLKQAGRRSVKKSAKSRI